MQTMQQHRKDDPSRIRRVERMPPMAGHAAVGDDDEDSWDDSDDAGLDDQIEEEDGEEGHGSEENDDEDGSSEDCDDDDGDEDDEDEDEDDDGPAHGTAGMRWQWAGDTPGNPGAQVDRSAWPALVLLL